MKKILFFRVILLTLFCLNVSVFCGCQGDADYDWAIMVKNGFFYPQDKMLRNIFCKRGSKGGYWLEGSIRRNVWKRLDIEVSASYFGKKGTVLCGNECTKVKIPTMGLGLKYFFIWGDCDNCSSFLNQISFFLGGGIRVFFYKEMNESLFVNRCVKETTVGGMANIGFEYNFHEDFILDLFFDYNFKKLKPQCDSSYNQKLVGLCSINEFGISCCPSYFCDLNLGGFVVGIGLGYKF